MIPLIIALTYLELYSFSLALFLSRQGVKHSWLCLIPFVCFYFLDKQVKGFTVLTIKAKSMLFVGIAMSLVILGASLYATWGKATLPEDSATPLFQLMLVPICLASFVMWASFSSVNTRLLFLSGHSFRLDWLVSLILLPLPILYLSFKPKEKLA